MSLRVSRSSPVRIVDLLVALVCLGATVTIFYWTRRDAEHRLREQFRSDAGICATLLQDLCEQRLATLDYLRRACEAAADVNSPDPLAGPTPPDQAGIRAYACAGYDRGSSEAVLRVRQVAPRAGNEWLVGFEPETEPACREAIGRAVTTGRPAATRGFRLPADREGRICVCVFQPIHAAAADRAQPAPAPGAAAGPAGGASGRGPTGLMLLVVRPDELMASALAPLAISDLAVLLLDSEAPEERRTLAVTGASSIEQARDALRHGADRGLCVERDLAFGGQHWTVRIGPMPGYLYTHAPRGLWWIPAIGFLFTLLIGKYLHSLRSREARAQALGQTRSQELAASDAKLQAITNSVNDAIVMMDSSGLVSFWNPAAEVVFGWTAAEALGQPLHDLIAAAPERARFQEAFPAFLATGNGPAVGRTLELPAQRRDGQVITAELSISAVFLDGCWHAVGILRDVTDRKRARDELEQAREQTEAMNRDLEAAIGRANEMALRAELANTTKSSFLANMSHEIRTPMNGVIGMTGLLLDSELTPEQRDCVETVRSCGESLLTIINDILDFSKIEAGRLELEVLDFDLHSTLEEMADLLAVKAHEKGLEFLCRVEQEVPGLLRGDPGRLRQILTNLIGNAIKFTNEGEVCLTVSVEADGADAVTLRCEVSDTGIGIPAEHLPHLFRPFMQVDASTTRRFGGTGLGLSICKRLVEMMGGAIGVVSEDRRGSTFWLTPVFPRQTSAAPQRPEPDADLQQRRVLVVDDNASSRRLLGNLLQYWGCERAEAADLPSAREALRSAAAAGRPFHVAVVDHLPGSFDGESLGPEVRQDPALGAPALVLMTPIGDRVDARRLQDAGFAACLTKPVKRSQFRQCLRMALAVPLAGHDQGPPPPAARRLLSEERRRGIRILVADDNAVNQKVALRILDKLGYRAEAVANGVEAVRALSAIEYDLVLMDCQMPEMDGYEATRVIRDPSSTVRNHETPILAMTAHAMDGDREKCLDSGMNDYVPKPVTPQELALAIEKWVGQTPSDGDVPESADRPPEAMAA